MINKEDAFVLFGVDVDKWNSDYEKSIINCINKIYDSIGTCRTCKYWHQHQTNENLMVCDGDNGCAITGDKFFCSSFENKDK